MGRLQITCNATFDGKTARHDMGFLNFFIGGSTDGEGELGQPKPIKHPIGNHQLFALVLKSGYRASAIYCNGQLVDTFTAPPVVQQPTFVYAFPGVMKNFDSSGQQITSLRIFDKALQADEIAVMPLIQPEGLVDLAKANFAVASIKTGEIRLQNDSKDPIFPASLIKVVTAMVALDHAGHCCNELTVQACDIAPGSGNNLKPGDKLSFQDALSNLLLESSNTTANLIAREVGGIIPGDGVSIEKFILAMNKKCSLLDMKNTVIKNPSGLHRLGMLSTAEDLAKAAIAATKYPVIMDIWSKVGSEIKINGPAARAVKIKHTHQLSLNSNFHGGKTGTLVGTNGTQNLLTVHENSGELLVSVIASKLNRYSAFAQIQKII